MTNNCNQECTRNNITGVHKCSCREGYNFSSGSESVCEGKFVFVLPNEIVNDFYNIIIDIDECDKGSHNCSLENRQMCINTEGSFECVCISGFNFVSKNCEGILYMAVDQYPQPPSPPPPHYTHTPDLPVECLHSTKPSLCNVVRVLIEDVTAFHYFGDGWWVTWWGTLKINRIIYCPWA